MSNDEFETWLSLVGRLLGMNERQRKLIGEELRDHLELRVAELVEDGMDRNAAVVQAVEEFGDAAALARNLQSVSLANRKRWMMRFMTFATAGVFLFALLTMAMWPENARFGSPSRSVAQDVKQDEPVVGGSAKILRSIGTIADEKIRKSLNQTTSLVFDDEAFGSAMEALKTFIGGNVVIDVNLDGILDEETLVSADLEDIRLADGLRLMLKDVDATFVVKDGVLLITSIDDEAEPDYLCRQMIDVRETLELIKANESDRVGKPVAVGGDGGVFTKGGLGGRGGGGAFRIAPQGLGGSGLGSPGRSVSPMPAESSVDDSEPRVLLTAEQLLIDTIQQVVHCDSWVQNGSANGQLTCIGGVLVVVNSELVVEDLRDFIVDLNFEMKNRE